MEFFLCNVTIGASGNVFGAIPLLESFAECNFPIAMVTYPYSRTRIAPTPSGYCHIGNALSFILTAGLAKQCRAKILLRIDDLDRERFREEYLTDVFDTLLFLGIEWDEGPLNPEDFHARWSQHLRMDLYHSRLDELRKKDVIFGCTCSRAELAGLDRYPGTCIQRAFSPDLPETAWRLKPDVCNSVSMATVDGMISVLQVPQPVSCSVVRKKNGDAAYHLASVADDDYFGVDLIVRGIDLYPSTLFQLCLSSNFTDSTFGRCGFHHHPLVAGGDGMKLSKSAGSDSIRTMRLNGYSRLEVLSEIVKRSGGSGCPESWEECFSMLQPRLQ